MGRSFSFSRPTALRGCGLTLLLLGLAACGDGGSDDDVDPDVGEPGGGVVTAIELLDASPADGTTQFDPGLGGVTLSHFGFLDFTTDVSGDCATGTTLERSMTGISGNRDALFQHKLTCPALTDNAAYELVVDATRPNGDAFEVRLEFSTTTATAPALQVQDSVTTTRADVAELFRGFIDDSLVASLDLPDGVAALIGGSLERIAESAFDDLLSVDPVFGVTAQRVSYASRRPDGSASSELTGLVAYPDAGSGDFAPRDSIIVLSHSTAVTPSDLDVSDAWYLVANVLASRGYLVLAPDNWGRGGTGGQPETYLMGSRTAANSLDLIRAVLANPRYDAIRAGGTPRITLVGYSQGGHTAIALWLALATQAPGPTICMRRRAACSSTWTPPAPTMTIAAT